MLRIEGYTSLFDVADLNGDVLVRGAFTQTIARRGVGNVRFLHQHCVDRPCGRWLEFREDARGLYVVGVIDERLACDVATLIQVNALDGLSVGFQTVRAERRGGIRFVAEVDLWEISTVTFPMCPGARITTFAALPAHAAASGEAFSAAQ